MQSVSDALNRLHEDGSWFARAHELHLWLIRVDASLRGSVLTLVPKFEFHADNRSAWPVLLDAHGDADDGWQLRANNLLVDWARRVEAFANDGVQQGAVPAQSGASGLTVFRNSVAAVLAAMAEPLEGLVIVLAPTIVERPDHLASELFELITDPVLQRCRWVLLLDHELAPPHALLQALAERAQVTTCEIDDAQQRRDIAAMLAAPAERFGTAWPVGVQAPRRVDDPPELPREQRDAALRAAGIEPAYVDQAPIIRAKVLGAALAMKDGRGGEAVALQREATALCGGLGLFELQVITQTALASYLSGLGQREDAKREVLQAITVADQHQLGRIGCQARLALGLLYGLDQQHEQAVQAYGDAARTAELAEEPLLAIEAWRMAGQHAANLGVDQTAAACFNEALRVAGDADARQRAGSSAAEAARALARIYERRGMPAQAASLHERADAFERGQS